MERSHRTALLVVGHGTHRQQGLAEFWALLTQTAAKLPAITVQGCFLERADPDIPAAMRRLARRGAQHVVVVPLLLFDARHAKQDIPRVARQAAQQWGVSTQFAPALGQHARIVELSTRRFQDAIRPRRVDTRDVLWILVGRGNRDPEAIRQFHCFLAERQRNTPVAAARSAFLAMAYPHIESVVEETQKHPLPWVVIQPHLLFAGELLTRLQRTVSVRDRAGGRQQWIMTDHLGVDRLVVAAIVDRFLQASVATGSDLYPQGGSTQWRS